jgi:hypothetical protein
MKELDAFSKDKNKKDGRSSVCKSCVAKRIAKWLDNGGKLVKKKYAEENKDRCRELGRKTQNRWLKKNKHIKAMRQAVHRARIKEQTPKWADVEAIKKIYLERPEGHHVDHIIPLNGKNVSGLHVSWNLQYLPAKKNMEKSNKVLESEPVRATGTALKADCS